MDTRKVQITGKSTYIVTLPKKWATMAQLESGSPVSMLYNEDGSLLIMPPAIKISKDIRKIKADKNVEQLKRDIIGLYIVGKYNTIEIQGPNISKEIRNGVKDLCKHLVGFEIVENMKSGIVIQNYLDTDEFTIQKGLKRMSSLVYLMLDELIMAFDGNDPSICKDIINRDDDIDRMFLLVSKQYVERLNFQRLSKNDNLSMIQAFYHRLAAGSVERIGDHISKIALHVEYTEMSDDARASMSEICHELQTIFMDAMESLRESNNSLANDVLTKAEEFNSKLVIAGQLSTDGSLEIIIDSFSRIRDYASNIAEHAIDLSQL